MLKGHIPYLVLLALIQTRLSSCDIHVYVSPHGTDQHDGITDSVPVKTIAKALALASNKQYINATVYIELMQGYYDLEKTLYMSRANTVLRSYRHQEVHVTGGHRIPNSFIKPVTDKAVLSRLPANARSHVRVINLHDLNITDFGKMEIYGTNKKRSSPLEVFFNGQALHLARWPNDGYIDVTEVLDGVNGLRFRYNSTIPQSWHNERDPWAYGYWFAGWTDGAVNVTTLDSKSMTVTLAQKPPHGMRKGHLQEYLNGVSNIDGGLFRFMNIFSALDQPGEYYMDRDSGKLYLWVPNGSGNIKSSDTLYISMVNDCIWITKPNIRLEDFTVEYCRQLGVFMPNVNGVKLNKLEIRNTGSWAVRYAGDTRRSSVTQCYIHDTCGGITVTGGKRTSLESAGNNIENNEIVSYDRVGSVGNNAVALNGIGQTVRYNHIYNGKSEAISFVGNDMVIEHNLIHHVCLNTSSCNAIRTGYDWTFRGNVLQYNIIHNVLQHVPGGSNKAVLLDLQVSGTIINYNVFINNTMHVLIAGGRYNEVSNNIMYNATVVSMYLNGRGISHSFDTNLFNSLHGMPYNSTTWSLRYPHLAEIDQHNASLPEGNQIVKNLIYMSAPGATYFHRFDSYLQANLSNYYNISQTGFSAGSVDHHNVPNGDMRVQCNAVSWARQVHFKQPPSPNAVGPLAVVGPTYLNRGRVHLVNTSTSNPCVAIPPAKTYPVSSFLPDGSPDNHVYHVEKTGCWLNVTKCRNHRAEEGTYRDMHGERYRHAADNETMCFRHALEKWEFCGSHVSDWVVAIYGPTGSATVGGKGCLIASYGCPKHGGPDDGHRNITNGKYSFTGQGKPGEEGCLVRSRDIWNYCGKSPNYPVTSVYLPTGAKRTYGGGCWITLERCPARRRTHRIFYDDVGATKYHTDDFEFACLHRAEYFWHYCGSHSTYPVTATYRPTNANMTYP